MSSIKSPYGPTKKRIEKVITTVQIIALISNNNFSLLFLISPLKGLLSDLKKLDKDASKVSIDSLSDKNFHIKKKINNSLFPLP